MRRRSATAVKSSVRIFALLIAIVPALFLSATAAGVTPGAVNFQGQLTDSGGLPVNGVVDLDFSLYDSASGGTPLWMEAHPGVDVIDGIYDVSLGSTTPLTAAVFSGGSTFLEIEVEGETLTPRQPIRAVPYAVQAALAENAESVNGVSGVFVSEIFKHIDYDGGAPPSDDPREGVADLDGDGFSNFIDPDNDGDGFSDVAELAGGADINLVSPQISSLVPIEAAINTTTTVTISGLNFEPGLTVAFGSESPVPQNLTSTSLDVDVGPQAVGVVSVIVTLPNGENDSGSFEFVLPTKRVFVSSVPFASDFGGIAGADAQCNSLATAAGRTGSFLAWLGDSTQSPATRFTQGFRYALYDDVLVAQSFGDLTDSSLEANIRIDEFGNLASDLVWTGVNHNGTASGLDCAGWTSTTAPQATAGTTLASTALWTTATPLACDAGVFRIYCFEQ